MPPALPRRHASASRLLRPLSHRGNTPGKPMNFFDPRRPPAPEFEAKPEPFELTGGMPPPDDWRHRRFGHDAFDEPLADDEALPPRRRTGVMRWIVRGCAGLIVLLVVAIGWLAVTAHLSRSLDHSRLTS